MTKRARILIVAAVVLVVAIVALALAARSILGGDAIKQAIEVQASAALGHPVAIGTAVPRIYPRVSLELRQVAIGSAREATVDYVRLTTGIRGLLRRRVEEAEVSVERSRIDVPWALALVEGLATASSSPASSGLPLTIDSVGSIAFRDVTLVAGNHTLVVDMDSALSGGDRIAVSRLDAKSGMSAFRATGEIASLQKRTGKFEVDASTLDFDSLLAFLAAATPAGARLAQDGKPAAAPLPPAATAYDVEIDVKAKQGRTLGIALTKIVASGRLAGGNVDFTRLAFDLFGGHFAGGAGFIGSGTPRFQWKGAFERLDVPQLVAFAGVPGTMTGRLAGSLDFTAPGADPVQAIQQARGTARLAITDGTVPNLEIVRTVVLAFGKPSGAPPAGSGEAFSRIAATLAVVGMNATTNDLTFASRDLDLRGGGSLSFARQSVDLRADVVLSRELSAQAGRDLYRLARDGDRIVLPATISGSIASPKVFIDVQSALQRALRNRAEDALKGLFDRWRKKE